MPLYWYFHGFVWIDAFAKEIDFAKAYTYNRECSYQILATAMESMFIMGGAEMIRFP